MQRGVCVILRASGWVRPRMSGSPGSHSRREYISEDISKSVFRGDSLFPHLDLTSIKDGGVCSPQKGWIAGLGGISSQGAFSIYVAQCGHYQPVYWLICIRARRPHLLRKVVRKGHRTRGKLLANSPDVFTSLHLQIGTRNV